MLQMDDGAFHMDTHPLFEFYTKDINTLLIKGFKMKSQLKRTTKVSTSIHTGVCNAVIQEIMKRMDDAKGSDGRMPYGFMKNLIEEFQGKVTFKITRDQVNWYYGKHCQNTSLTQ